MKDEKEAIRKLIVPILKEQYFVRTSVRLDRIYQKLKTEGFLSPKEMSIKHPFHPDIDILHWIKDYTTEPLIYASEVKYFRTSKEKVYPNIYDGLGAASMLLTFGVDYVCLLHLFDPEIPSEVVEGYKELTQNLIDSTRSPVNYKSFLLTEIPTTFIGQKSTLEADEEWERFWFTTNLLRNLKINPLIDNPNAGIIRSVIKKAYRMVSK